MALVVITLSDEDGAVDMKVLAEPAIPNGDDDERTPAQEMARTLIYGFAEAFAG